LVAWLREKSVLEVMAWSCRFFFSSLLFTILIENLPLSASCCHMATIVNGDTEGKRWISVRWTHTKWVLLKVLLLQICIPLVDTLLYFDWEKGIVRESQGELLFFPHYYYSKNQKYFKTWRSGDGVFNVSYWSLVCLCILSYINWDVVVWHHFLCFSSLSPAFDPVSLWLLGLLFRYILSMALMASVR